MQPSTRQIGRKTQKSKYSLAIRNPSTRRLAAWSNIESMPHVWLDIRMAGPCSGKGATSSASRRYQNAQKHALRPQSRRSPPRISAKDRRAGIKAQGPTRNATDRASNVQELIAKSRRHPNG